MNRTRGSAALVTVVGAVLLMGVAIAVIAVSTDVIEARGRAVTAADAAALAAASSSPLTGGDDEPQRLAEELAAAGGGDLVTLDVRGWPWRVGVVVDVAPNLAAVRAVVPTISAQAAAAVEPGAPIAPEALAAHAPPMGVPPGGMLRPASGRVSSPFGWRVHPVHGDRRHHAGIDIAAPHGSAIRAAAPGVVVAAGRRGGYGLMVEIDHGGGLRTRYAHASRLHVARGARVAAGEVLAAVGETGTATGPHLHFEVRQDGRPVDPAARLHRDRKRGAGPVSRRRPWAPGRRDAVDNRRRSTEPPATPAAYPRSRAQRPRRQARRSGHGADRDRP